jgi:negative elongation factor E
VNTSKLVVNVEKLQKKTLVKHKTPRSEPERSPAKISKGPKIEARDAREVAKKLLKTGAISPIVKTPKRSENEGFKRIEQKICLYFYH